MLDVEQIKQIPKLREQGLTTVQIAKQLGVHRSTIFFWQRRLKKAGYPINTRQGRPAIKLD